ncbi:MAG: hypothetical protein IT445_15180 [Phycisphaeraceae bacterium]|nr:hypothetical protein [Phycisphaeraceae bacterium]
MIQRDHRLSLIWGAGGLLLETTGAVAACVVTQPIIAYPALALAIVGVVMLTVGMAYHARSLGRNPWWGLVGLLYIVGSRRPADAQRPIARCPDATLASIA